ncbi:hypothetical protein D9613_009696 [Agrocybe pediades]|uniref:HMA domain-containing protein n=1 Tax=Agrocybe pediades TaxID=84607 RepID=A0A8H4VSM6_9AGAR|nr:hypothetical protein D9613_009696 [Agrocybe pediades]
MPNRQGQANDSNDSPNSRRPLTSDPDLDEFKFAPKKPEGDIWEIALEPLMKIERAQCDAWKEEVQNLLIFAGLFSAVVTAFVIESYKTLQVDPQDTMVSLLSQMLVRMENGTAIGSPPAPTLFNPPPFVPNRSAERINIFWFISLIFSLATALIGIISLQWLREYQSYANFNSEETLIIFNMRKDGFEKWHVSKVFAALPLLLQAALVLFLAGMVDFSLALGIKVGIPIIIAIALTLAFLLLTTVLPTFQGLLYLFHLPTMNGPQHLVPQCPYKSPQSRAFRILADPLYAFSGFVQATFAHWQATFSYARVNTEVLQMSLSQTTWSEYDDAWLWLRYIVSQKTFGRMTELDIPYPYCLGLTDLLACLRRIMASHIPETSMAAAYHCFLRVALSIEDCTNDSDTSVPTDNSLYYWSVMINEDMERDQPLSGCLDTSGVRQSLHSPALRYQALANFLSTPLRHASRFSHYLELHILLKRWMYSDHRKLETSVLLGSVALPAFVRTRLVAFTIPTQTPAVDSPLFLTNSSLQMPPEALINDYCTIYVSFFTCISKGDQYRDWTTSIHMTPEATELLTDAASVGHHNLLAPTSIAISNIIIECLQTYLVVPSNERNGDSTTYNLLLYAASIYLSAFPRNPPNPWTPSMLSVYNKLEEARIALIRYKAETRVKNPLTMDSNHPALDTDSERTSTRVEEASSIVQLAIGGMTCVSCVRAISEALSELDGVSDVTINLLSHSGTATVSRPSLADSVVNLIEDIGYEC